MSFSTIPFIDFEGSGATVHFAHANGFPPATYQAFIGQLKGDFHVLAMQQRPLWGNRKPDPKVNWSTLGDDLIQFLDERGLKNIIGMGHSMGGVATTLAAAKRPDLFKKIVLIEPVFFTQIGFYIFSKLPHLIKARINPMIKAALKRRDTWTSKEASFEAYRSKRVFSNIPDEALRHYIDALLFQDEDGKFRFTYSKEWEAHFYGRVPWPWPKLAKVQCPVLGIRGETTDTLSREAFAKWEKVLPHSQLVEIKGAGHLVPLEKAEELATVVKQFIL